MKFVYTFICLLLLLQAQATVRRVRAGNTTPGTGGTWAAAYSNLQSAIDASASGDEVWVAVPIGTAKYQPASGVAYQMKAGVKIYGGFAGSEAALANRNITTNVTILQGNNNSVVRCAVDNLTSSALLDGFTITGGNTSYGGGIDCAGSSPSFSNLIIKNNFANSGGGGFYGYDGSPTLTNVVFMSNAAGDGSNTEGNGGGLYNDESYPILNNVVFYYNYATRDGGAIYTYSVSYTNTRKPVITNTLFAFNEAGSGAGGAVFGYATSYIFTNCTFATNYCYLAGCGGALHNYGTSTSGTTSTSQVKNCLFWGNFISSNNVPSDVSNNTYATTNATYSMLLSPPATGGNVAPSGSVPFVNTGDPDGQDNTWLTADDGYRLTNCNPLVIDKGDNTGVTATDITGQLRRIDMPLVTDGGNGTAPIVDMGAYENQTTATAASLVGSIGNAHMVPSPQELAIDSITNVITQNIGMSIGWEKNALDGNGWVPATPNTSAPFYIIPALTSTTQFRRTVSSATYCNTPYPSNIVQIKVVLPNGKIQGLVKSRNGTGVANITMTIQRATPVEGGQPNRTVTLSTTDIGYTATPLYYGDPASTTNTATFRVTPSRPNHLFNPPYRDIVLNYNNYFVDGIDFTDTTVIAVTGGITQVCTTCTVPGSNTVQTQTCPLDSVKIYKNGSYQTFSQNLNGNFGRYGITLSDPGQITLTPDFNSHQFSPGFRTINVTDNYPNADFVDTTTHVISGLVKAGCANNLGRVILEFADVLPAYNGNPRSSCFNKRDTTTVSGFYSTRLPARKYRVTVVDLLNPAIASQTDPAYVSINDLQTFFNNLLPADSVSRDITKKDTVMNLTYLRKPFISITQGLDTFCNGQSRSFALFRQGVVDSFRVKIFQGPSTLNCPITDTTQKIRLYTSVDTLDNNSRLHTYNPADTGVTVRLRGGAPYIVSPYLKGFTIQYSDKYHRGVDAELTRKVVVTGVKADTATFTTVSPEIPLLVLHDPPGDGSSSYWQSTKSITNAMRFYAASGTDVNVWLQAKIGTDLITGLGVSTESSVWGTLKGNIGVSSSNTTSDETINTYTTSQTFSTSGNPNVIGQSGDVYIGAALNLIYAGATELRYANCKLDTVRKLIVADQGFDTKYIYSESQIRDVVIPTQLALSRSANQNSARPPSYYINQANIWQQVLDNNAANKARAAFVENVTFDGSVGPISSSVTSSSTKTSTIEFNMNINGGLAAELGFEIAGSGLSGGVDVAFKTETGQSTSGSVTKETTIGYTITDDDPGDYFTINIKKDPVYATPVFDLVAGTASCPAEPGAQPRDEIELYSLNPVQNNIPANDTAYFYLYLANLSESGEARTYLLSLDQSSNSGAAISINGSQAQSGSPVPFNVGYLAQTPILIGVKRLSGYSFEGLRFIATDACGGSVSKSTLITANFANACSGITLASPENGWYANAASGNTLPIQLTGYNVAGVNNVSLQYAKAGTGSWVTAFSRSAVQLNPDGVSGTAVPWDITFVQDSVYDLRLQLSCGATNIYSQRATGLIDRRAPLLLGNPEPTDGNYVNGDVIAFSYNEKLNINNLNNGQVIMNRLSNHTTLPVTVSGYENRIVIVPVISISGYTGETIQVIVTGISDLYGNVKTTPDTSYFLVGSTIVATGTNAMKLAVTVPVIYKNSDSTINVIFKLPVVRHNGDTRVNYTVSGTARLGIDYDTAGYGRIQPSYTYFNGSQGSISIAKDSLSTVLRFKAIADTGWTPDKTIIISLSEGGDYALGDTTRVTGKITSEDSIATYTFTGDGYFNVRSNWLNNKMPLTTLMPGKTIFIDPSGVCRLNVPLTIKPGAILRVKQNKELIVPGSLRIR